VALVKNPIRCAAHPDYTGTVVPKACHQCWMVWEVLRDLKKGKLEVKRGT